MRAHGWAINIEIDGGAVERPTQVVLVVRDGILLDGYSTCA